MKVVVDTNVVFSALLSDNSKQREILLKTDYEFLSPNFIFIELFKYKEKIKKYSRLNDTEILEYFSIIIENIQFIRPDTVTEINLQSAYDLCKDVDEKDTVFIALALEFDANLWTGDKKLMAHLESKGFSNFFIL